MLLTRKLFIFFAASAIAAPFSFAEIPSQPTTSTVDAAAQSGTDAQHGGGGFGGGGFGGGGYHGGGFGGGAQVHNNPPSFGGGGFHGGGYGGGAPVHNNPPSFGGGGFHGGGYGGGAPVHNNPPSFGGGGFHGGGYGGGYGGGAPIHNNPPSFGGGNHGGGNPVHGGGGNPVHGGGGNPVHGGGGNPVHGGGGNPVHGGGGNPVHGGGGNPVHGGGGNPVHGGGGNPVHGGGGNPVHGGGGFHGPISGGDHGGIDGHGRPFQHDPHGNRFDAGHFDRVNYSNNRAVFMRNNTHINVYVNERVNFYNEHYEPIARGCWNHYNGFWGGWHRDWAPWFGCGFYGGYYWAVNPFWAIDTYYYIPGIYWFYNDDWNDNYYTTWYGGDYSEWPVAYRTPFRHHGAFFPTEEFRDLNVDINGAPMQTQIEYRRAMSAMVDTLATEVATRGGDGELTQGSVVVDHYQLLLDSDAVEVEGFVSNEGIEFPFTAILYLQDPEQPEVFIPGANETQPTELERQQLELINSHITDLGGVVTPSN
jgi:hypothetical protein